MVMGTGSLGSSTSSSSEPLQSGISFLMIKGPFFAASSGSWCVFHSSGSCCVITMSLSMKISSKGSSSAWRQMYDVLVFFLPV